MEIEISPFDNIERLSWTNLYAVGNGQIVGDSRNQLNQESVRPGPQSVSIEPPSQSGTLSVIHGGRLISVGWTSWTRS